MLFLVTYAETDLTFEIAGLRRKIRVYGETSFALNVFNFVTVFVTDCSDWNAFYQECLVFTMSELYDFICNQTIIFFIEYFAY